MSDLHVSSIRDASLRDPLSLYVQGDVGASAATVWFSHRRVWRFRCTLEPRGVNAAGSDVLIVAVCLRKAAAPLWVDESLAGRLCAVLLPPCAR